MSGPFRTEAQAREAAGLAWPIKDANLRMLMEAISAAGVELGSWDRAIVEWLAGQERSTVIVIAGLIIRARQPEARAALLGEPGAAQRGGGRISGAST